MEKFTITSDGNPPITFTGEQLSGCANRNHNSTRWTIVELYRTQGGKIVSSIERRTQWEGERDQKDARVFDGLGAAIVWLKNGEDCLGRVSQEAVEEAIKKDPSLAKFWVQEVD